MHPQHESLKPRELARDRGTQPPASLQHKPCCPGRDLITTTCPGSATELPGSANLPAPAPAVGISHRDRNPQSSRLSSSPLPRQPLATGSPQSQAELWGAAPCGHVAATKRGWVFPARASPAGLTPKALPASHRRPQGADICRAPMKWAQGLGLTHGEVAPDPPQQPHEEGPTCTHGGSCLWSPPSSPHMSTPPRAPLRGCFCCLRGPVLGSGRPHQAPSTTPGQPGGGHRPHPKGTGATG